MNKIIKMAGIKGLRYDDPSNYCYRWKRYDVKSFLDTSTDGQWDGNILADDLGSNPLGLLMSGTTINHVCVTYAAGACA